MNDGSILLPGLPDDILQRMQTHVTKKRSTFRSLGLANRFFSKDSVVL
jgi:hypothetical protein